MCILVWKERVRAALVFVLVFGRHDLNIYNIQIYMLNSGKPRVPFPTLIGLCSRHPLRCTCRRLVCQPFHLLVTRRCLGPTSVCNLHVLLMLRILRSKVPGLAFRAACSAAGRMLKLVPSGQALDRATQAPSASAKRRDASACKWNSARTA